MRKNYDDLKRELHLQKDRGMRLRKVEREKSYGVTKISREDSDTIISDGNIGNATMDHNDLNNIDGGTTDEYYHLKQSAHDNLKDQDQELLSTSDVEFASVDISSDVVVPSDDSKVNLGKLSGNTGLAVQSNSGYISIGVHNSSYAHIYTDRAQIYTAKGLHINGHVLAYSSYDLGSSSYKWINLYIEYIKMARSDGVVSSVLFADTTNDVIQIGSADSVFNGVTVQLGVDGHEPFKVLDGSGNTLFVINQTSSAGLYNHLYMSNHDITGVNSLKIGDSSTDLSTFEGIVFPSAGYGVISLNTVDNSNKLQLVSSNGSDLLYEIRNAGGGYFHQKIDGNVYPYQTDTHFLGTSSYRWKYIVAKYGLIENIQDVDSITFKDSANSYARMILGFSSGSGGSDWRLYWAPRLADNSNYDWGSEFGWQQQYSRWYVESDFLIGGDLKVDTITEEATGNTGIDLGVWTAGRLYLKSTQGVWLQDDVLARNGSINMNLYSSGNDTTLKVYNSNSSYKANLEVEGTIKTDDEVVRAVRKKHFISVDMMHFFDSVGSSAEGGSIHRYKRINFTYSGSYRYSSIWAEFMIPDDCNIDEQSLTLKLIYGSNGTSYSDIYVQNSCSAIVPSSTETSASYNVLSNSSDSNELTVGSTAGSVKTHERTITDSDLQAGAMVMINYFFTGNDAVAMRIYGIEVEFSE